jgi:hypothetical protein
MAKTLTPHLNTNTSPPSREWRGPSEHLLASGTHDWLDSGNEGVPQSLAVIGSLLRPCLPARIIFRPVTMTGTLADAYVKVVVVDDEDDEQGDIIPSTRVVPFPELHNAYGVSVNGRFAFPTTEGWGLSFVLVTASATGTAYTVECLVLGSLI